MDPYRQMFENLLFEFNWGQLKPDNQISDPKQVPVVVQQISNTGQLEDLMAKYHNWFNAVHLAHKKDALEVLNKPETLKYREAVLTAFEGRLQLEQPHHPLLTIYNRDRAAYQTYQDLYLIVSQIRPVSLKTRSFMYIAIFITKTIPAKIKYKNRKRKPNNK